MPKKLIVANWKMKPETLGEAAEILESINQYLEGVPMRPFTLTVCPPFVFTEEVSKILSTTPLGQQVSLGAQDIAESDETAQTGEISGPMLSKLGVRSVIIGHSERRWKLNESNEVVNAKLKAALRNNLMPIVCLGERERSEDFKDFLVTQTEQTFAGLDAVERERCIVAYEPVWAISTNPDAHPDTPESAEESIQTLRQILPESRMLYGGSVSADNAMDFLSAQGIEGVLVGGASVRKEEFVKILSLASKLQ